MPRFFRVISLRLFIGEPRNKSGPKASAKFHHVRYRTMERFSICRKLSPAVVDRLLVYSALVRPLASRCRARSIKPCFSWSVLT